MFSMALRVAVASKVAVTQRKTYTQRGELSYYTNYLRPEWAAFGVGRDLVNFHA